MLMFTFQILKQVTPSILTGSMTKVPNTDDESHVI